MKTRRKHRASRQHGVSLIECLAYMAIVVIVLGLAIMAFNDCWDRSNTLRRNAEDIVRVLHVGDRWRADIRAATGPIASKEAGGAKELRIPSKSGEVLYTFSKGEVRRQSSSSSSGSVLLSNVKSSQMQSDLRGTVAAWRWELELKSAPKKSQSPPLFTFEGVAGGASNP